MSSRLALAVVALLAVVVGSVRAEDRRIDKTRLVIMTFNADFLWDGVEPEEGTADFDWKHSQVAAEEHMAKIAEVIRRSNPDVVNLCEVENLQALQVLNNKYLSGDNYVAYLVEGGDHSTGQDMGLLTRIDPEQGGFTRESGKGSSGDVTSQVTKNYIARMLVGDLRIALIGAHLIAGPDKESLRLKREAQADLLRMVAVKQRESNYLPIVLGDLNDLDDNPDSLDAFNTQPVSNVLKNLRAMDPANPQDDLVNAAKFAPKATRYTNFYDRNYNDRVDDGDTYSAIDHILLAPELAAKVGVVEMPHQHDPTELDHFPVVVTLRLSKKQPPATQPSPDGKVMILSLLPDPIGSDSQKEAATILNATNSPADMTGWKLRDSRGKSWALDSLGILEPGKSKSITRSGQSMSLNNDGDTVALINAIGVQVDTLAYGHVEEGEEVTAGQ